MDIGAIGMVLMFVVGLIAGLAVGRGAYWKQRSEDYRQIGGREWVI